MSTAGLGVVAIWHDLTPEIKSEFYEWHNREHMPERVGIPGFLRGRRYIAIQGAPEYFNLYEADSPEVLGGQDYLNRLNSPTPWTKQVVPSFRNVSRSICKVAYTGGVGHGGVVLTKRFDVPKEQQGDVLGVLRQQILPAIIDLQGISGAHLFLADQAISTIETAEKKARADTTAVPSWIVMIEGSNVQDVQLGDDMLLQQLGRQWKTLPVFETSIYQLEHTCCKTPWVAG